MSNLKLRKRTKTMIYEIDKFLLPLSYVIALLESILPYNMLLLTSYIVNSLTMDMKIKDIVSGVVIILILRLFLENLTSFLGMIYNEKVSEADYKYRAKKTEKYMKVEYLFVEKKEYEDIRQRIRFQDESMGTFKAILNMYHTLALNTLSIFVAIIVIFHMGYTIVITEGRLNGFWIMFFVTIVILTLFISLITKKLQEKSSNILPKLYDKMSSINRLAMYLAEMVVYDYSLGKDIRIYRADRMISQVFIDMINNTKPILRRINKTSRMSSIIGNIISLFITGIIYVIIGGFALVRLIPIGNIVLYSGSVTRLVDSITSAIYVLGEVSILSSRIEPVFELFDISESRQIDRIEESNIDEIKSLKFENVWFKYSGTERYAIKNVSFEIKANEKVMFVGANGAGKSTVIKLLCGLYRPTKGKIYINGININKISSKDCYRLIKAIFQDFHLFSFSIAENIAISTNINKGKIQSSLELVGLKKSIERKKYGIDTPLYHDFDKFGEEISGGEAQKIAMARLVYADASVVILDEPTAALDPIAEAELYEKFHSIVKGKIAIFVSHRLASSKICDRILVFDEGELVQNGTHKELISRKNGVYYDLWKVQKKYYS